MSAMKTVKCPHCHKQASLVDNPYRPFCSQRCKMVDLGTWVTEGYSIPGEKAVVEEEESGESDAR